MSDYYNPEHYKDPTAYMAMKPKEQETPAKVTENKPKTNRHTTPKSTVWTKVWDSSKQYN